MKTTLQLAALALTATLCACSGRLLESDGTTQPPQPPQQARFDYQLGGTYDVDVTVVTRDSTAAPLAGAYSICYVNGFQTQPGEHWEDDLLVRDAAGVRIVDPAWPDEYILDTGTEASRAGILDRIGASIDLCAASGFDAIEIDNLDTWTRYPALLDKGATLTLATSYAERAHAAGLAIAQKNAAVDSDSLRNTVGFDFAVAEECMQFGECGRYTDAYGAAVFDIEYTDALSEPFDVLCSRPDRVSNTILRDRDLGSPDDPDYTYRQCRPAGT